MKEIRDAIQAEMRARGQNMRDLSLAMGRSVNYVSSALQALSPTGLYNIADHLDLPEAGIAKENMRRTLHDRAAAGAAAWKEMHSNIRPKNPRLIHYPTPHPQPAPIW